MNALIEFVSCFPQGVAPSEIERALEMSRTTLNRRLNEAVEAGQLLRKGRGPATRYSSADPHTSIRAYFERPYTERPIARFDPSRLTPDPGLDQQSLQQFDALNHYTLDKHELEKFLIDFSCASSVLEGGTYSLLDTQVLLDYGEHAPGKPVADAFLVLNHKTAFGYLYDHMQLESIYEVHARLTSDHELPELKRAPHWCPNVEEVKLT